jgi:hypothetical protein
LERSGANQETPISRLMHMNPGAVELYTNHKIDLFTEALEVAVCAQHNNGGLAGNIWYESTNLKHLFPIGEINGSHGVTRPGGSALNAGQVAGFRAAEFIANRYAEWTLKDEQVMDVLEASARRVLEWAELCLQADQTWTKEMQEVQERMSQSGSHIRKLESLKEEVPASWVQVHRITQEGAKVQDKNHLKYAFRLRQLAFAQAVYLEAIQFSLISGVGSRGSSIVVNPEGSPIHKLLDSSWKMVLEDDSFRSKVLETYCKTDGKVENQWVDCHPIPESDSWFETTWARYRNGEIYQ